MNISLSTYDHHHSPEQLIDLVSSINSQTKIVDYGQVLPTLSAEVITLKRLTRQTFGHVICILLVSVDMDFDVSILDMAPEEVPLDQVVLGVRCDALVDSKEKGAVVVLKHLRADGHCH